MKKIPELLLISTIILGLAACSAEPVEITEVVAVSQPAAGTEADLTTAASTQPTPEITTTIVPAYDSDDLDANETSSDMAYVELQGDSIALDGSGATVDGTMLTITSAGMYSIHGTLNDGQIIVDTDDEEAVGLVLNGADIACSTSAPIYTVNAAKTVITLADGTENVVTDGASYTIEDPASDEPNAAIFSKDDLTINGGGSLTVNATYNDGIASKDDLRITGGTITVNAVNDGIQGRDSVAVYDGNITINAGGDGVQATNAEDADKGYIAIEAGQLDIRAGLDAIQAASQILVSDGTVAVVSGGGNAEGVSETESAKGLKAGADVTIGGGTLAIDSADDALHSNGSLTIESENILLVSGDDGIHADASITINGGDISITESYEGLESAVIMINGGNTSIVASDDGINVAGGADGSSLGRPGENDFTLSGDQYLAINGGYILIDAAGDGLDVNGAITMSDGLVVVNGPTANNNGALDCDGTFDITGGLLVAAGSSGMAEVPSTTSTQYSALVVFPQAQAAGTMVHIETSGGEEILTFVPTKAYQSLLVSSSDLENGSTYVVTTGGSSTGTAADGLYTGGTYAAGTETTRFTISSIVTGGELAGSGFGGGGKRP